jgi:hypothetical protein
LEFAGRAIGQTFLIELVGASLFVGSAILQAGVSAAHARGGDKP